MQKITIDVKRETFDVAAVEGSANSIQILFVNSPSEWGDDGLSAYALFSKGEKGEIYSVNKASMTVNVPNFAVAENEGFKVTLFAMNSDATTPYRYVMSPVWVQVKEGYECEVISGPSKDNMDAFCTLIQAFQGYAEAEAARVNSEAWRVDAENQRFASEAERLDAEIARSEAENDRQIHENERKAAEITRTDSEYERLTAELARVEAENERVVAELARSEFENQRLRAELERVEAEKARVIAENERAAAEVNRNVKITEHDADITVLKTSMSAASNDIAALEEKEKTLSENGALHSKDIANLKNDVSDIGGQASDNAEDIARIKGGSTVVEKAKCDRNGNIIDATYAKKSELLAEISARNAFECDITPRLAAVEELADGNSKDIGELAGNVDTHNTEIKAIGSRLDAHDSEIGSLVDFVFADLITDVPATLEAKREYCFGEVEALSLVFPTIANAGDVIYLTFKSGEVATTLAIDTTNTTDIEVIPEANCYYDIFAKFNGSVWLVNYSEYLVSEV